MRMEHMAELSCGPALRALLADLRRRPRVRTVHQEMLLALHLRAPDRLRRLLRRGAALDAAHDEWHSLVSLHDRSSLPDGIDRPQLRAWLSELRAGSSRAIFKVETSSIYTYVQATRGRGLEALRAQAFQAAETLSILPSDWLQHPEGEHMLAPPPRANAAAMLRDAEDRAYRARTRLCESYLGYALRIALKYARQPELYLDLYQEAADGLLEAIDRYDLRDQVFKQYATSWMFQRVMKAHSDHGHLVRRPTNRLKGLVRCETAIADLASAGVSAPGPDDVLVWLGAPEGEDGRALAQTLLLGERLPAEQNPGVEEDLKRWEHHLGYLHPPLRLDHPAPDGLKDTELCWGVTEGEGDALAAADASTCLTLLLANVPEREAQILRAYYGIGFSQPLSLEEIGLTLGLTRERVRQLKEKALRTLRRLAKSDAGQVIASTVAEDCNLVSPVTVSPPLSHWAELRLQRRRAFMREIKGYFSDSLPSYRPRHRKEHLRIHLAGALRRQGGVGDIQALMKTLNERLQQENSRLKPLEESYIRQLLYGAPEMFIPFGPRVWGLVERESSRPAGAVLPYCPSPVLFDMLPVSLELFLARGERVELDRSQRNAAAARCWAGMGAYLLDLAEYAIEQMRDRAVALTVTPPDLGGGEGRRQILDRFTERLEHMPATWGVIYKRAPISEGELIAALASTNPFAPYDTGNRLAFLELLGAARRDDGGRWWLTPLGLEVGGRWAPPSVGASVGVPPAAPELDGGSLTEEAQEELIEILQGL